MDIFYNEFIQTKLEMISKLQSEIQDINLRIDQTKLVVQSVDQESSQKKDEIIDDLYKKSQEIKKIFEQIDEYEKRITRVEGNLIQLQKTD
ncbi:hypothetical protein TTHERM_000685939 (macronuclear) [Tetrahymena thermophila SB210]|uniref:Uncharacterized protein n=1 Tax=Tetrahymena thermophila (strain SB210) TaxID=312017 RepID=W7X232_TETTS|nr:hypothetical protein TTHERM_000685939 [Tetrahymena thermophila SB210]EWS71697.1 hypothetical protein TTHERM_000685939 [Tetrahymena thermophila SB210]|eukprot:XP_012655769.1 hypothetical protein TTHERM_000685939 [Tetrahymena thermophila SB210]